jgi:hypothetical protein
MTTEKHLQSCIDECTACHAMCMKSVQYCLEKSGSYAAANHIRLLLDCAEICATSVNFMLRGSDLHAYTCGVCAEVCDRCARACDQVGGGGDVQMRECAETCRRCAQKCHEMAAGHALTAGKRG